MLWIAAGLVAVLVPLILVIGVAWRSFVPPREPVPPIEEQDLPWLDAVAFASGEWVLRGWIRRSPEPPRGVVILVHGWGSHAVHMLTWARFLAAAGWVSLAFDLRGHGRSEGTGSQTLPELSEDVWNAHQFLDGHAELRDLPRAVLGHSMGGAAVLHALAMGLPVQGAIISSAFARVETLTAYVLRKWLLPPRIFGPLVLLVWQLRVEGMEALEPERTIRRVGVPLLLTHGTRDPVIPGREMRRLEEAAPGAEILHVEGAGHSDLVDDPGYQRAVLAFLERPGAGNRPAGAGNRP